MPEGFGRSVGPLRPIDGHIETLSLQGGGIDTSVEPAQLAGAATPYSKDVKFDRGGVSTDQAFVALDDPAEADEGETNIIHLAPFETTDGLTYLMRVRPLVWDRWNGSNWLELGGTTTAQTTSLCYSVIADNRFIVANGVDKLKSWTGDDGDDVVDLSADAPIARFVTRLGGRLIAADITVGAVRNRNLIARSADGDIEEWLDSDLGAGSAELLPEGSNTSANFISGLSTIAGGVVVYRHRSIQLGTLTGIGAAPIRFNTVDFEHGTESPYSIASGGAANGDLFLGHDFVVYLFNGQHCVPVGLPIQKTLRKAVSDLERVIGRVDELNHEYWMMFEEKGSGDKVAYIFDIFEWAARQRLCWRKKSLASNTTVIGVGSIGVATEWIVDDIDDIVDTVLITVDSAGASEEGNDRIVVGDEDGQVWYVDEDLSPIAQGIWRTKPIILPQSVEYTISQIRVEYKAIVSSTVQISISKDGGNTFMSPKVHTLLPTGTGTKSSIKGHDVTGRGLQIQLETLTGSFTITKLELICQLKGRTNG